MNIVSFGGGTNSTAMIIGMYLHKIPVDLILFADTGGEQPHTYEFIRVFNAWLDKHGLPKITPVFYTDKDGNRLTLEEECFRSHTLPSIAYGFKKCSLKHKIGTQEKFCNHYPPCVEVWKSGCRVNKYIGYDAGETRRMLDNRRVEMGLIHPRDLPNGVKYVGHLNSPNIDIYTYAEVYLDDWTDPAAPKTLPLVPENKVVLIASHPDYMMAYGACTYIEDSTQQWVTAQTDRLLRSFVKHQPDRRMLELQARPLPIPDKVDSWFVATVC